MKPLATFRLYPDGNYFYAVINIWATKKEMQDHVKCGRGYMAICTPLERILPLPSGGFRKLGQFCEINFFKGALGVGVISHEMGHAAFCWAGRKRISIPQILDQNTQSYQSMWERTDTATRQSPNNPEERVVYVLGELCRKFVLKGLKLGLY